MGFWDGFTRTAAEIDHAGHRYRVELRIFAPGKNVTLRRDGVPVESASTPARFTVSDGAVIEVDSSEHGFRRAVLRSGEGTRGLEPAEGTWEAARRRWADEHPVLSRVVAVLSSVLVAASLALLLMQVLEEVTSLARVREALGGWSFTSPVDLPPAALVMFGVLVGAAALERALRMR